jgi:hypothetical protein
VAAKRGIVVEHCLWLTPSCGGVVKFNSGGNYFWAHGNECTLIEPAPEETPVLHDPRVGDMVTFLSDGMRVTGKCFDVSLRGDTFYVFDGSCNWYVTRDMLDTEPSPSIEATKPAPVESTADPRPCATCGLIESCRCGERRAEALRQAEEAAKREIYRAFNTNVERYVQDHMPRAKVVTDHRPQEHEDTIALMAWVSCDGVERAFVIDSAKLGTAVDRAYDAVMDIQRELGRRVGRVMAKETLL